MRVTIMNGSTLVTDAEAAQMTAAVAHQAAHEVWTAWGNRQASVVFLPGKTPPPAPAHVITLVDTIQDQPQGVLGYHTEDPGGIQWGIVAAKPELDAGGKVLTGDWSVSSVLSHEVLELLIDPACNLWAADGHGRAYSYEACDPVEAPTYEVAGVSVSNFVLPAWFDPEQPSGAKYDHLGLLRKPFSLLPGGYCVYLSAGAEHQVYGEEFPDWRRAMKSGAYARTRRRIAQAEHVAKGL
ncbi:MAG: hypothetical protein J2P30_00565 [Actinobacteria bacterium]|nr:hypothetical protein [Actinomycetota bacterium]